jgi:hypothetical protein
MLMFSDIAAYWRGDYYDEMWRAAQMRLVVSIFNKKHKGRPGRLQMHAPRHPTIHPIFYTLKMALREDCA